MPSNELSIMFGHILVIYVSQQKINQSKRSKNIHEKRGDESKSDFEQQYLCAYVRPNYYGVQDNRPTMKQ